MYNVIILQLFQEKDEYFVGAVLSIDLIDHWSVAIILLTVRNWIKIKLVVKKKKSDELKWNLKIDNIFVVVVVVGGGDVL